MTCAVCGAATTGPSTICGSCDQVVGRGRFAGSDGHYSSGSGRPEDVSSGIAAVWFVVLLAITLGSTFVLVGRPTDAYTSGELLGDVAAHILLALIIAGLLRWTAKARFWRTFLITWAILIPLMFISNIAQRSQLQNQGVHQALLDLRKVMNAKSPATGSSVAPTVNQRTVNQTVSSDGSGASALQVAIEHIAQNAAAFKQQQAARTQREKDLHIELLLQPQRLVSAQGIGLSRSSVDQYRNLMTEQQTALKTFEDKTGAAHPDSNWGPTLGHLQQRQTAVALPTELCRPLNLRLECIACHAQIFLRRKRAQRHARVTERIGRWLRRQRIGRRGRLRGRRCHHICRRRA
jgi:hypothetical protein